MSNHLHIVLRTNPERAPPAGENELSPTHSGNEASEGELKQSGAESPYMPPGEDRSQVGEARQAVCGEDVGRSGEVGVVGPTRVGRPAANVAEFTDDVGLRLNPGSRYSVGPYDDLTAIRSGFDAHHVGQKAAMRRLVPGYDPATAPSILVPRVGHTVRAPGAGGGFTVDPWAD